MGLRHQLLPRAARALGLAGGGAHLERHALPHARPVARPPRASRGVPCATQGAAEGPQRPLHVPVVEEAVGAAPIRRAGAEAAATPASGAEVGDGAASGVPRRHGPRGPREGPHPLVARPVHEVPSASRDAGASGARPFRSPSGKAARNRAASPSGAASGSPKARAGTWPGG